MPEDQSDQDERRGSALDLLEANHTFPTDFSLSVIARNDDKVSAAVVAAASAGGAPATDQELPSAHGKYVSHRLSVRCETAQDVLALFARLRAVEGVITVL